MKLERNVAQMGQTGST